MTFNNLPAQRAPLTFTTVIVERGGAVFRGFQSKLNVFNNARLNTAAAKALLTQLGMPPVDPSVPLALTAASYQGVWDARDAGTSSSTPGTIITFRGDGSALCQESGSSRPCSVTITNPATGAFTGVDGATTVTGTLDFMTGSGSGTFNDPSGSPTTGNFVIFRR